MNYKPRLDGLRCLAIMMVLIGHFLYFLLGTNSGIYGVNLFFVLSGFLITSILLNNSSLSFKEAYKKFIARRALRIFPIYYLLIFLYILVNIKGINSDWPYLLTYTYNFHVSGIEDWEHHVYSPYWSLSVEEQFYLFFPFVVLLFNKKPKTQFILFIVLLFTAVIERYYQFTGIHSYVNLITNMWALVIGALGAWLTKYTQLNRKFFNSIWVEISFFVLLALVFREGEKFIGFVLYPLINIYFVLKASSFSFKVKLIDKLLVSKVAITIGRISYGIYLYHILVKELFDTYVFQPIWASISFSELGFLAILQYNETLIKFPFLLALTFAIAYLSFKFIELPFLKLKDRFFR